MVIVIMCRISGDELTLYEWRWKEKLCWWKVSTNSWLMFYSKKTWWSVLYKWSFTVYEMALLCTWWLFLDTSQLSDDLNKKDAEIRSQQQQKEELLKKLLSQESSGSTNTLLKKELEQLNQTVQVKNKACIICGCMWMMIADMRNRKLSSRRRK